MSDPRQALRCRWAEPTLFLANPLWTAAEDYPWSCQADGLARPIEDTASCGVCTRWAARAARGDERAGGFRWQ
jgi:hypothetical protein